MTVPCEKEWVDIFSAVAPTAIATVAVVIAGQQWVTSRNNLKLHLFDKRWAVYEELGNFINLVMTSGENLAERDRTEFLRKTKGARFLFDEKIESLIEDVYEKSVDIDTKQRELPSLKGDERAQAIREQNETKKFLTKTQREKDDIFQKWLKLRH